MSLRIERRPAYLYAVASGVFSVAGAKLATERILEACGEHRRGKVLVDIRALRGTMSTMNDFECAAFLAAEHGRRVAGGLPPVRFAFLGNRPVQSARATGEKAAGDVADDRFGETVMLNRGLDAKSTTDPAEALEWLGIPALDTEQAAGL